jgi:hypothetical protein
LGELNKVTSSNNQDLEFEIGYRLTELLRSTQARLDLPPALQAWNFIQS